MRSSSPVKPAIGALLGLLGCACPPTKSAGDATAGATETTAEASTGKTSTGSPTASTTSAMTTSTTLTSEGTTGTTTTGASGCGFLCTPDAGSGPIECYSWIQDCPEGFKCSPAALDGAPVWIDWICVPLPRDPGQLLEPCTIDDDPLVGDDCDKGLVCWNGSAGGWESDGVCLGLCSGSEEDPTCPAPDQTCWIGGSAVPSTCLIDCDPLAPACPLGENCVDLYDVSGGDFVCFGQSGSGMGDPCYTSSDCAVGLACTTLDGDCPVDWPGCCTPYCDQGAVDPCAPALPEAKCLPYYGDDPPLPGWEHLGLCDIPP